MTNLLLVALQAVIVLAAIPVFLGSIFWISARLRKQNAPLPWTMYRTMARAGIHEHNSELVRRELPWMIASVGVLIALLVLMPLLTSTPLLPGIANPITIAAIVLSALVFGLRERSRHSVLGTTLIVLTVFCAFLSMGLSASMPTNVMDLVTIPRALVPVPLVTLFLAVLALWWDVRKACGEVTHALSVASYAQFAILGVIIGVLVTHILVPFGIVTQGASLRDVAIGVALLLVRMGVLAVVFGVLDGLFSAQRHITALRIALAAGVIAIIELLVTIILIFV